MAGPIVPFTREELHEKFTECASLVLPPSSHRRDVLDAIESLETVARHRRTWWRSSLRRDVGRPVQPDAMNLAWISIAALVIAVSLSCTTTINVGVLSLALALDRRRLSRRHVAERGARGFPTPLFVTLVGVTLLFSIAETNGTLERVTARAVRLCRGHAGLLPIMFFVLGLRASRRSAPAARRRARCWRRRRWRWRLAPAFRRC